MDRKILLLFTVVGVCLIMGGGCVFAAVDLDIASYSFSAAVNATDAVTFSYTVQNNTASDQASYGSIVLTKDSTETYVDVGADTVPANGTTTFTSDTWISVTGTYTVTIIIYDAADQESDRQSAGSIAVAPVSSTVISATSISFPAISGTDKRVLATGSITLTLQTPALADYDYAALRVYTQNAGGNLGLVGQTYPDIYAPLKVWIANYGTGQSGGTPPSVNNNIDWKDDNLAVYLLVLDKNMYNPSGLDMEASPWNSWPIFEWTDLYKFSDSVIGQEVPSYIDTTYDIYLAADFTNAIAQTYSTNLYFEFIYNTDGGSASGISTVSTPVSLTATVLSSSTLSVYPTSLDLGVLPYGRSMHYQPLEITYAYNEKTPWYLRIYTDNFGRYTGIPGALYQESPAGLVSSDGKYTIPLKVWCLNFGPDPYETGWDPELSGPPPVEIDDFWRGPFIGGEERDYDRAAWLRVPDYSEMGGDRYSWRVLMGIDPYDPDLATDANPMGNFTLDSPFNIYLATETTPSSVAGTYLCDLIIEVFSP